jgi:molecular chaperone DnaJ
MSLQDISNGVTKKFKLKKYVACPHCHGSGAEGNATETCPDCGGSGRVVRTQQSFFGMMRTEVPCPRCEGEGKIIKNKCPHCNGDGIIMGEEVVEVQIPAGVTEGMQLTMRGKGNCGKRGGEDGDLHIIVNVDEHRLLDRDGFDLHLKLYVPFYTLLLGGEVEIPLAKGTTTLKIPELTQSNTIFKLRGKGIKYLNRETYGNLIVTVVAETPKSLSKADKKAIEELKKSLKPENFSRFKDYQKVLNKYKD